MACLFHRVYAIVTMLVAIFKTKLVPVEALTVALTYAVAMIPDF